MSPPQLERAGGGPSINGIKQCNPQKSRVATVPAVRGGLRLLSGAAAQVGARVSMRLCSTTTQDLAGLQQG